MRLLCLGTLLPLLAAPALGAEAPTVILLSWDGVRPDYLDRAEFPALERMAREGVRAERLIPVWPPNTFPNHVALATGTYSDRHGIVNNRFLDRERGPFSYENDGAWIEAEPLWAAAERQGVPAATFFWVGSETDWNGTGARYRKAPFDSSVSESEKVDQILAWIDLPEAERPRLVMSWWHGADAVGHASGPAHPAVARQLAAQDRELSRLLAGLDERGIWDRTTLIVVSDHGMVEVSEAIDLRRSLEADGIRARVMSGGGVAHVYLEDPGRTALAVRRMNAIEGVRAYARAELPIELRGQHPQRAGDVVALTDPPRTFYRLTAIERGWVTLRDLLGHKRGMHGYDPDHPEMAAVFLALGRGVPSGLELGSPRAIDVAPTVARLLGIEAPASSEGLPIAGIGEAR